MAFLESPVGDWTAERRLWAGEGAQAQVLPPVAVTCAMVGPVLQGTFTLAGGAEGEPFTRRDCLNWNAPTRRWECVSLDTRFPGLMPEQGVSNGFEEGRVTLWLPVFTSPGWGEELTGEAVSQRREIALEADGRLVMRQFWTEPMGEEYLAVEYVLTR